jgi:hypothetical protein
LNFTEAQAIASKLGGTLATPEQLTASQAAGAQWCTTGWLNDKSQKFPMQQTDVKGCGDKSVNVYNVPKSGAVIYGPKPPPGTYPSLCDATNPDDTPGVFDFYRKWSNDGPQDPKKYSQFSQ